MDMIFPSLYEELDMQRYAKLAAGLVPNDKVLIALCDDSGQIVWLNRDKKNAATLMLNSYQKKCVNMVSDGGNGMAMQNGVSVVYCNLGELSGLPAGQLVFYDIGECENSSGKIVPLLNNIAEIVKVELGYLYEVNAMASELGDRYDELSMLHASDVALTEYLDPRHILSTYIRSCAEHLAIDYAAIWVPARLALFPGGVAYQSDSTEILLLLERLSIAAYAMFQNGCDGFGINNKDEVKRYELGLPADKKALLVPILNKLGEPCGVLCCLNEFKNKDFSNSDKTTLDAVSRKTSKYLLSTQDELTGLLNRKGFDESVWRDVFETDCERHLVLFNIDGFKVINAAYGITTGDIMLCSLAERISKPEHELKFIARLDADTFSAIIESPKSDVESLASNICGDIDTMRVVVDGKSLSVKSRAGVIVLNSKETALADHIYAAELALISAKEEVNQIVVYKPGNTSLLKQKHQLTQVESIKNALAEDRFVLYCQRIQPFLGNEVHYEILVRMLGESGEIIEPEEFIPVAERYNLMSQVDRWIIEHSLMLLSKEEYRDISTNYKWGINLSGMTIGNKNFHEFVSDCLHEFNFQPTNLYFEITETAAIKNFQNCASFMNKIHSIGVQFALDDFGSGLSSFSYLKKLSIDYLKIDGSLIKDIVSSELDQTMVSAIAGIAKVMNVKTIAEYVENDSILEKLRDLNIDYAQGFEIMKPQAIELELNSLVEHSLYKLSLSN